MSESVEKRNNAGRGRDLPAGLSPLLVLCMRQERNAPFFGCGSAILAGLLMIAFVAFGGYIFISLLPLYLMVARSFFLLWQSRKNWESSKLEPLLITPLGSFRIARGIWLTQMMDVALAAVCFLLFEMMHFSGVIGTDERVMEASQILYLSYLFVIAGFMSAFSVWARLKNWGWKVAYLGFVCLLVPLLGLYYSQIDFFSIVSPKKEDLYFWLFPLVCLLVLGAYVFLVFAAGCLESPRKVEPLAFRKAMLGTLVVPVSILLYALYRVNFSNDLFLVAFYAACLFLCFCFMNDAVRPWCRRPVAESWTSGWLRWGGSLFLRQGWQSGALLLLVLSLVMGTIFDAARMVFFYEEGKTGMGFEYGMYALLIACNCLLVYMGVSFVLGRYAKWGHLVFLPVGIACLFHAPLKVFLHGKTEGFLSGMIPFVNMATFDSGKGPWGGYVLFVLLVVFLYGIRACLPGRAGRKSNFSPS